MVVINVYIHVDDDKAYTSCLQAATQTPAQFVYFPYPEIVMHTLGTDDVTGSCITK